MKTWYNDWHYWIGMLLVWIGIAVLVHISSIPPFKFLIGDVIVAVGIGVLYWNNK